MAAASRNQRIEQLLKQSRVPRLYQNASLDEKGRDEDHQLAADSLKTLATKPKTVIMFGKYRTGKTYLACAAVLMFCRESKPAQYWRAIDIFTSLKSTFGPTAKRSAEDLIAMLSTIDALVIDEIQVRSDSEWENSVLRSLIDQRHANLLSTIICGNVNETGMQSYLGAAVWERVAERGRTISAEWCRKLQVDHRDQG